MRLSREESLDVFGQVCYILLEHLQNIKDPDKLIAYVITTTRRQALLHDRKARLVERVEQEASEKKPPSQPATPDEDFQELERADVLMRAMARLSRKEARLVQMLFLDHEEPTYEQISSRLKMPVSSIGPTRSRVLTKLYRIMKQLGYKFLVF
jgi:RNA polymerase sigma factor (sigma-70 family)